MLRERVTQELSAIRVKLQPYTENMKTKILQRVDQLNEELAPYVDSMDTEALRVTLMQNTKPLDSAIIQRGGAESNDNTLYTPAFTHNITTVTAKTPMKEVFMGHP